MRERDSDDGGRVAHHTAGWHHVDMLRALLVIASSVALIWMVHRTSAILLAVFLSMVFGVALSAGVDRLSTWRVPRSIGAALILLAFFAAIAGLGRWLAPTIRAQSVELRQKLPIAVERVQAWIDQKQLGFDHLLVEPTSAAGGVAQSAPADSSAPSRSPQARQPATLRERIELETGSASRFVFPVLHSTAAVLGGILFITFLAADLGTEPGLYRRGALALFAPSRRERVASVFDRVATVLRKWLVTQLIIMVVMGAASTLALFVLHVKAAVALGVLAGVLSFIPTVGGVASAAPAIAMGFLDSPQKALLVGVVYLLIHFLGSHVFVPLLMRGGIDLPPALTLLAQAMLASMFGFLGLMVAVPLLATVLVVIRATYVEPMARRGD